MKIGIFDSGVGGLSVLRLAKKRLPHGQFIYYADLDHVPYGERTEGEIRGYVGEAAAFMLRRGVDAIVLACNTATSVAAAHLRESCAVPVVGMEPAVKKALDEVSGGRVLVVATPITVRGDKLRYLIGRIDTRHLVDTHPLPALVRLAESGDFESGAAEEYLRRELSGFDLSLYSSVVLGCTHFGYFADAFRRVLPPAVRLIDGCDGTVNQLIRVLGERTGGDSGVQSVEYFESGRPASAGSLSRYTALEARLDMLDGGRIS